MLKYLIIQLCDTAPLFCHYNNVNSGKNLISVDNLKAGIRFSMKENLNVQFFYPDYELPNEYKELINYVDHTDVVSYWNKDEELRENADYIVIDSWLDVGDHLKADKEYVLRTSKQDFFDNYKKLIEALPKTHRINVVFSDVYDFKETDFNTYKKKLSEISDCLLEEYKIGKSPLTNILTDRMMISGMNNCNAGVETITLAPDGKFYICPAFYLEGGESIGDLKHGVDIKNQNLLKLEYAPICRVCDAYQCKRCVWLNKELTLELNTPSREQCIMAHLERNESQHLLNKIRENGEFMPEISIKDIDYLDPFDKVKQ